MDVVHPRCCGIDVHQASLAVCVAIKENGKSEKHKLRCGTTTAELLRLADWLRGHGVTHVAEVERGTAMTLAQMCQVAAVSRAGWYRRGHAAPQSDRDIDLRDDIQKIALEMPSYGRRRITEELRRRGWKVNHKRVARIMREDNLLCLRRRKFVVATTDSRHDHTVYPNLAGGMELTAVNQLWVADITYIRLETSSCIWP
jgi:hypothetical protein